MPRGRPRYSPQEPAAQAAVVVEAPVKRSRVVPVYTCDRCGARLSAGNPDTKKDKGPRYCFRHQRVAGFENNELSEFAPPGRSLP